MTSIDQVKKIYSLLIKQLLLTLNIIYKYRVLGGECLLSELQSKKLTMHFLSNHIIKNIFI